MGREYRLQAGNKEVFIENEDSANTPEKRFYHLPPLRDRDKFPADAGR